MTDSFEVDLKYYEMVLRPKRASTCPIGFDHTEEDDDDDDGDPLDRGGKSGGFIWPLLFDDVAPVQLPIELLVADRFLCATCCPAAFVNNGSFALRNGVT